MAQVLNTSETHTIVMVETNTSKDITVLEKTVQRLARELRVVLQDTSGISYIRALEGKKNNLELDYHLDSDSYECLSVEKGDAQMYIMHIIDLERDYFWNLRNFGKNLLKSAYQRTTNPVEKRMDLWILDSELQNELSPEKISNNSLVTLTESELDLITAQTILKYLS